MEKYIHYQLCPKCNGDGNLARYNSPPMSTSAFPQCDVCNGNKTLICYPVPASIEKRITDEEKKLLRDVYGVLWTNACYDPDSEQIQKFSKPLSDKMMKLNETLKFKE